MPSTVEGMNCDISTPWWKKIYFITKISYKSNKHNVEKVKLFFFFQKGVLYGFIYKKLKGSTIIHDVKNQEMQFLVELVTRWKQRASFFQNTSILCTSVWGVLVPECSFYEYLSNCLLVICAVFHMYFMLKQKDLQRSCVLWDKLPSKQLNRLANIIEKSRNILHVVIILSNDCFLLDVS